MGSLDLKDGIPWTVNFLMVAVPHVHKLELCSYMRNVVRG